MKAKSKTKTKSKPQHQVVVPPWVDALDDESLHTDMLIALLRRNTAIARGAMRSPSRQAMLRRADALLARIERRPTMKAAMELARLADDLYGKAADTVKHQQLLARRGGRLGRGFRAARYQLPDDEALGRYMYLLHWIFVHARTRAYKTDPQIADLLDAVENLPDLLLRWHDMDESIVIADIHRIESSYPEWKGCFSTPLEEGAPEAWERARRTRKGRFAAYREYSDSRTKAAVAGWRAIVDKYQLIDPDPSDIGTCFGPGWLPIIDETIARMIAAGWDREIGDVKSKFCRLVIYVGDMKPSTKIKAAIKAGDAKAGRACEDCGRPHKLKTPMSGRALCTRCEEQGRARRSG